MMQMLIILRSVFSSQVQVQSLGRLGRVGRGCSEKEDGGDLSPTQVSGGAFLDRVNDTHC